MTETHQPSVLLPMASWGIAEWYGADVARMSPEQRHEAAERAILTEELGLKDVDQPVCPFLATLRPGATCNKAGGVCSIRQYIETEGEVNPSREQPVTTCPNRFLEHRAEPSLFAQMSAEFFGSAEGLRVIKETPFLEKEVASSKTKTKAGRIDWIMVPEQPTGSTDFVWAAVETQAVYFSGTKMFEDFTLYAKAPDTLHLPAGNRRPDFRSSGAKRLAPQLQSKSPVVRRWGKKVVVVVDLAFFNEMGAFPHASDFDNSEVVWVVVKYDDEMKLVVHSVVFAEMDPSIQALQAAKPVNKFEFEAGLRKELGNARSKKVYKVEI